MRGNPKKLKTEIVNIFFVTVTARDGTNGNLQDFRMPDGIESLKSKIGADTLVSQIIGLGRLYIFFFFFFSTGDIVILCRQIINFLSK